MAANETINMTGWYPHAWNVDGGVIQFFLGTPNKILNGMFGPGILFMLGTIAFLISLRGSGPRQSFGVATFITFLAATILSPLSFNGLSLIDNNTWVIFLVLMVIGVVINTDTVQNLRSGGGGV